MDYLAKHAKGDKVKRMTLRLGKDTRKPARIFFETNDDQDGLILIMPSAGEHIKTTWGENGKEKEADRENGDGAGMSGVQGKEAVE